MSDEQHEDEGCDAAVGPFKNPAALSWLDKKLKESDARIAAGDYSTLIRTAEDMAAFRARVMDRRAESGEAQGNSSGGARVGS